MMIAYGIVMKHLCVDGCLSGEKSHKVTKVCVGYILNRTFITTIGAILMSGRPNISMIKLKFIIKNFFYNSIYVFNIYSIMMWKIKNLAQKKDNFL